MRKTIFTIIAVFAISSVMCSCGYFSKTDSVVDNDSTVVDTVVAVTDTVVADTVVTDTVCK